MKLPLIFPMPLFQKIALVLSAMIIWQDPFHTAEACQELRGRDYEIFKAAQVILRAKIIGYTVRPTELHALFQFETIEVVVGQLRGVPRNWTAEWTNSTYGVPETWKAPLNVIVGLAAKIDLYGKPVLFVVQQPCSLPSIVSDTPENLRAVANSAGISLRRYHRQP